MWKRTQAVVLGGLGCLAAGAMLAGDGPADRVPDPRAVEARAAELPPVLVAQKEAGGGKESKPAAPDLGWIGLMLEEGKDGIRVGNVFPGGPAAFAGVRTGDVLVKVGDASPDTVAKAVAAIEKLPPEKPATVTVRRDGKPLELKVNVGNLTEFHERYIQEMLRRDPRDPKYSHRHGVSDADMQVELVRRLFEQNQRLETTLHQVLTEVQALRAEMKKK